MSHPMSMGTLEIQPDPIAAAALERKRLEQRELFRLAGVNALARSRNGRDLSPDALADARKWAAYPPLQGPMSAGEPQT